MGWTFLTVIALAASLWADRAPAPSIRLRADKDRVTVDVAGLSKDALAALAKLPADSPRWAEVLEVFVDRPGQPRAGLPAMLGSWAVEREVLRFVPRYRLARGVRYRAVLRPAALPGGAGQKPVEAELSLPRPKAQPTTVVTRVYPSKDHLPENLLKFYLHFSAPMSQGDSYRHVSLLDGGGKPIDLPFLELGQELWDPDGTRFTLLFDPGRIKRGLKPREDLGPVLEKGKRYTLVIDRAWRDAEGNPLKESYRKTFTVTAPVEAPLDVKTWKVKPPTAGTRAPLRVSFPAPLDHALLHRLLWVEAGGKKVPGRVSVEQDETVWLFTPEHPWAAGAHDLAAGTSLEDLAGNNIGRPFEVDVLRPVQRQVKAETVKVPFAVK
jgi:hypothetical protein